jgi:hypothetical protein
LLHFPWQSSHSWFLPFFMAFPGPISVAPHHPNLSKNGANVSIRLPASFWKFNVAQDGGSRRRRVRSCRAVELSSLADCESDFGLYFFNERFELYFSWFFAFRNKRSADTVAISRNVQLRHNMLRISQEI